MKKVYPIESRCINCHLCEVACIIEHSESKTAMGAYHVEGLRFNLLDGGDITDPAVALVPKAFRELSRHTSSPVPLPPGPSRGGIRETLSGTHHPERLRTAPQGRKREGF